MLTDIVLYFLFAGILLLILFDEHWLSVKGWQEDFFETIKDLYQILIEAELLNTIIP